MFTYNNNHILSGYIKQFLSSFNLPTSKIYSDKFIRYYEKYGKEHPEVVESFSKEPPNVKYSESGLPETVFPRKVNYLRSGTLQKFEFDPFYNRCIWKPCADVVYYTDKFHRGLTKSLKSEGSMYDSKTHEYLGEYLRYLRDAKGINLMSMYNCFSNKICNNLNFKIPFGTRQVEDRESYAKGVKVLSSEGNITHNTEELPDGSSGAYKVTTSDSEKLLLEFQNPIDLLAGLSITDEQLENADTDSLLSNHTLEVSVNLDVSQTTLANAESTKNGTGLTISLGSTHIPVKLRVTTPQVYVVEEGETVSGLRFVKIPVELISNVTIDSSSIPCVIKKIESLTESNEAESIPGTLEVDDSTGQVFLTFVAPTEATSYYIPTGTKFGMFQLVEDFGAVDLAPIDGSYAITLVTIAKSDIRFKRSQTVGQVVLEAETYGAGPYRIVIPSGTLLGTKKLTLDTELIISSDVNSYDSTASGELNTANLLNSDGDTTGDEFMLSVASVTRVPQENGKYFWTVSLDTTDSGFVLPVEITYPAKFVTKQNKSDSSEAITISINNSELVAGWQTLRLPLDSDKLPIEGYTFTENLNAPFNPMLLTWLRISTPGGRETTLIFDDIRVVYSGDNSNDVQQYKLWECDEIAYKNVSLEAHIDTRDRNTVVYKIPAKLFEEYTIAIDSFLGAEIFCGLYTDSLVSNYKNNELIKYTYKKYNRLNFHQPILYDRLGLRYWTADRDFGTDTDMGAIYDNGAVTRYDLLEHEQDLYLFIKLPSACKSSIVVLAGDYRRFNDAYLAVEDHKFVYKQNKAVLNFETSYSIDSKISTRNIEGEGLPSLNDREFVPISRLQLLALNTKTSHPFADRLVEYLTGWAITSEDEIGENISRAQAVMRKNYYKFISDGAWEPKMQMLIYDYLMNDGPIGYDRNTDTLTNAHLGQHTQQGHTRKDNMYDILGFIDRDAEKLYASWGRVSKNLPTGLRRTEIQPKTTIETVDIYDGLYDL